MIYFVAGAPRAGKTYVARRLMARLGIPLLELDYLKMGFTNGLPDFGIHPLQDEETLGERLWPYVAGMIKAMVENGDDYIVEGCYVLPKHADETRSRYPGQVRACFLGYADVSPSDKLAEFQNHADGYDGPEATALLERFVSFSRFLRSECSRFGFAYVEVRDRDDALEAATRQLLQEGMALMQPIGASLLAQFDVLMDAVEQAIELSPDDRWAVEGNAAGAPVRQVYHILGGLDVYCMKRCWGWDKRFLSPDGHFSWESDLSDAPSRAELMDYLRTLRSHLRQWLPQHDDAQYLSPTEEGFRGQCLLDEMLYILRHSHYHLGEIQIDYRLRGLAEPEWRW